MSIDQTSHKSSHKEEHTINSSNNQILGGAIYPIEDNISTFFDIIKYDKGLIETLFIKNKISKTSFYSYNNKDKFIDDVINYNKNSYTCYAGIQPRRVGLTKASTANDIVALRYLYLDIDSVKPKGHNATNEEKKLCYGGVKKIQLAFSEYFDDQEPFCFDSGNGFWLLLPIREIGINDENRSIIDGKSKQWGKNQKELFAKIPGIDIDLTVFELRRVTKIPGTKIFNKPDEPDRPQRISCLIDDKLPHFSTPLRKEFLELKAIEHHDYSIPSDELLPKKYLQYMIKHCLFMKYVWDERQSLSEPLWMDFISNACRFKDGTKLIHEYSKDYPNYSYQETEKRIDRHFKGSKPITCAKIRADGYDCKKNCGVRSPAGLRPKKMIPDNLLDDCINQFSTDENISEIKDDISKIELSKGKHSHDDITKIEKILHKIIPLDNPLRKESLLKELAKKSKITLPTLKEYIKTIKITTIKSNAQLSHDGVFQLNNALYYQDKKLTSFRIEPIETIRIDKDEFLRAKLISEKEIVETYFSPDSWDSLQKFKRALPTLANGYYGNDKEIHRIKTFCQTLDYPKKTGTKTTGFHKHNNNWIFVTHEGGISKDGTVDDFVYFNPEVEPNSTIVTTEAASGDELQAISKIIDKFNDPKITLPILGWITATFYKPMLFKLIKGMGGFPILTIAGEYGAGKTSTVNLIAKFWCIDGEKDETKIKNIYDITRFTLMVDSNSTNTIPLFIDENNKDTTKFYKNNHPEQVIDEFLRSSYNNNWGSRGEYPRINEYHYTAPAIISGNTSFFDGASLERIVPIHMSKKESSPCEKYYQKIIQMPLDKLGKTILNHALSVTEDELKQLFENEYNNVDENFKHRIRTNIAICRAGLKLLELNLNTNILFDINAITTCFTDGILDENSSYIKSTVDHIIEGILIIIEQDTIRLGNNLIDRDPLDPRINELYEIQNGFLRLKLREIYPIFKNWAHRTSFEYTILPISSFRKQLRTEPYIVLNSKGTVSKTLDIGCNKSRCIELDINEMLKKGLEISPFFLALV